MEYKTVGAHFMNSCVANTPNLIQEMYEMWFGCLIFITALVVINYSGEPLENSVGDFY